MEEAIFRREMLDSRLDPNAVYDDLVQKLFQDIQHKADENRIVFARRGKSDRTAALTRALKYAKDSFDQKWGVQPHVPTTVTASSPSDVAGLQVVDCYLWALQRMYERSEDRYFNPLAPDFRLIKDLDDDREKGYGAWYSDSNPLTLEKIRPIS